MSTSRIEIPLTLPPPHFDDDATIATARQVVPIKGARRIQGGRKVLTLVPLLIASTLCGALGAIGVNYFERRRDAGASVTPHQLLPSLSTQAKTEPTPAVMAPEGTVTTEVQASNSPKDPEVIAAQEPPAKEESIDARREDEPKKSAPPAPVKRDSTQDAAKLVRKRRVQPADSEIPVRRNRRTEAGRIEDLFTGPNP